MITDQHRLILMNKMTHATERELTCNRKQKSTKKRAIVEMINRTVSIIQSNDQKNKTLREKLESYRKVVSGEMMCFKIMKLFYKNSIYTKTF